MLHLVDSNCPTTPTAAVSNLEHQYGLDMLPKNQNGLQENNDKGQKT